MGALLVHGAPQEGHNSSRDFLVIHRPKTTVSLTSRMGVASYMVVRCWSSERDVGLRKLADGQSYEWRFRPNIWGSTKYVCSLAWQKGTLTNRFYQYDRDIHRCDDDCRWFMNSTGIYGMLKGSDVVDIIFPWQTATIK
ncbi:hypothetical protein Nepgr_030234 [Nepenthes gracilis]|uniref:S-protein homolog n=1 Tax=Nepenthes gracilis TaxID=150966 RepID=A0AAD3TFT8_NEPGR|nr:hypothetical protein Nepgr_030234 [Nepenthes gracilis]